MTSFLDGPQLPIPNTFFGSVKLAEIFELVLILDIVICNQTLSVNTGKNKADLFNFFAINKVDDRFNKAEYLASLTRNGTGLTISGRVVTDAWTDKATHQTHTAPNNRLSTAPAS